MTSTRQTLLTLLGTGPKIIYLAALFCLSTKAMRTRYGTVGSPSKGSSATNYYEKIRDVFLHTGRQGDDETVRVWKLTDGQLAELIQFLTSDSLDNSNIPNCPLPLRATRTNYRVDDWDAMAIHRIFRDPWERKIPEEKDESNIRLNTGDHPELENMFDLINSAPSYDISLGSNYNTLSRGVAVEGPCSSHGSLGSAQGAHETERPSMTAPEQPDSSIPKGKLGPPWEGYDDLDYFDF